MKKNACLILVFVILLVNIQSAYAREISSKSLREAERLYQKGNYEEASEKALEYQKYYPDSFQALVILGMSDYYLNNYKASKDWFNRAKKQDPKHPVVTKYLTLLKELEYRSGPFSGEPKDQNHDDPQVEAEFFKRGYFGHAYPVTSLKDEPGASSQILEPVLINEPVSSSAMRLTSKVANSTPYPSVKSLFSSENYMEKMAREAMEAGEYEKSYLFYSQLLAYEPNNINYLISKAEAAFYMKHYAKVLKQLLPISSKETLEKLPELQRDKVKIMLDESAKKRYVPGQKFKEYD